MWRLWQRRFCCSMLGLSRMADRVFADSVSTDSSPKIDDPRPIRSARFQLSCFTQAARDIGYSVHVWCAFV